VGRIYLAICAGCYYTCVLCNDRAVMTVLDPVYTVIPTCLCPSFFHYAYQVVSMKAEDDLNTEVGEELLPILFPGRKTENKVSCACVCTVGQFT
jgi:hypothetical protein